MTREEAESAVKQHGGVRQAARALGVPRRTMQDRLDGIPEKQAAQCLAAKVGRSLADFRAEYDKATIIPARIKAGLKALGSGWEYEVAFAKAAGVSLADLGMFRPQFDQYVVVIRRDGKRAWAGTTATAQAMKDMLT